MTPDPLRLVALTERGVITPMELMIRAAQLASEHNPANLAAVLPPACLAELREAAEQPTAGRVFRFSSELGGETSTAGERLEAESRRYQEGLLRWRAYFDGMAHERGRQS